MKKILLLTGLIGLFTTTGCIVHETDRHSEYRGHEHYRHHEEVIVGAPVVVVRPPEVIIR